MKILYNLASTFNSGGMERIVLAKINYLSKLGYDVTLVTTDQQGRTPFFTISKSVKLIDLNINYSDKTTSFIHKILLYTQKQTAHKKALLKCIYEEDPDVVVSTFGNEAPLIADMHIRSKKVLEIHFSKYFRLQENRKGLWGLVDKIRSKQDEFIVSKFDKFVVLTKEDMGYWGNLPNITVIPNFISNLPTVQAPLQNKVCVAVGRLCYQKGFDRLIDIWNCINKSHPEWKLIIYGNGELKNILQRKIETNHLQDKVILHPSTTNIGMAYRDSSILLSSSRYEGLPMVILEAFSYGLPAVSFACKCGPRDIITDGEDGFVIKDDDYKLFIKKLTLLIENDELRKRMGDRAFITSKKYSEEAVMKKWIELFTNNS